MAFVAPAVLLAACLGGPPGPEGADGAETDVPVPSVVSMGPVVRVSPSGHRISEFAVARSPADPGTLVVAAMDYDDPSGALPACQAFVSRDGGATWSGGARIPGLDRPHLRFDPWAAIDLEGTVHFTCIDERDLPGQPHSNAVLYARSADNGSAWAPAVIVPTLDPANRVDKSVLHSLRNGTLVTCFGEAGEGLVAVRSTDGGATWTPARTGARGLCSALVEAPDGTLLLGFDGNAVALVASRDGGASWAAPVEVAPSRIYPYYNNAYRVVTPNPMTTTPSFAVSPTTGAVVVGIQSWDDARDTWGLELYRAADAAGPFAGVAPPAFVPEICDDCHETFPLVAFDGHGRLGLQVTLTPDGGLGREVWFAASLDEGATWLDPVLLSRTDASQSYANADTWAPNAAGLGATASYLAAHPEEVPLVAAWTGLTVALVEPMQKRWAGEYWGLVDSATGFVAFWVDGRGGHGPALWSARVDFVVAGAA